MHFEPWVLAAMDEAGYNGIRSEHIGFHVNSWGRGKIRNFPIELGRKLQLNFTYYRTKFSF